MKRQVVHNIHEDYSLWKKLIELDYYLLGLADDVFVSPVKYYFSSHGFGIILSRNVLIVSGSTKDKVRNEVQRLDKKIRLNQKKLLQCVSMH
ncbi:MAG: hypothetical protein KJ583_05095 [Nanoarchaeota archaeon]|nr:hypothetical protein [Nanoarchaeota archaeon]MBU1270350.1 hypothetical protein [Nanoarchaeota archaeon]MBU1604665.1 hypothetical protein [Nanoarchaeota archaeon]MBU2443142.1 hypothetical protein [Nanoarchaeota archaeon]